MGRTWLRRLWERIRTRSRWREIANGLLLFPVALGCQIVAVTAWAGSLALVGLPLYAGHLPGGHRQVLAVRARARERVDRSLRGGRRGCWASCVVAPWTTVGAANLQALISRRLLGRTSEAEMAELLRRSEGQRSAAVDSAETERRRIERDLHDGAQQRLVALAAGLGAAREKLDDDPDGAKALVADAHEEAKSALKEIRDLVRGIHPVILEDRGLDAALSAVVARSPVPVRLAVRRGPPPVGGGRERGLLHRQRGADQRGPPRRGHPGRCRHRPRRLPPGHRGPRRRRRRRRRLAGSGLQGLRERVDGLGGNLRVISPPGGPTTISVELPCAS